MIFIGQFINLQSFYWKWPTLPSALEKQEIMWRHLIWKASLIIERLEDSLQIILPFEISETEVFNFGVL